MSVMASIARYQLLYKQSLVQDYPVLDSPAVC